MRTSNRSVSHPCSKRVSATSRTAVYGPVRTVVWEGRSCEAPPYPDQSLESQRLSGLVLVCPMGGIEVTRAASATAIKRW